MSARLAAALAAYIGSIVAANWLTSTTFGLIPIGFGLMVTAGTFTAGAALILRDGVDTHGGRWWVAGAITVGIVLSYLLADPFIALASAVAFAASEVVDWGAFRRMLPNLPRAVLVSSVVSAPVDTVLFLWIAGFPVTWQAVAGQFIVKTLMAALAALWLARR
jgi:queuosine precursor transporter